LHRSTTAMPSKCGSDERKPKSAPLLSSLINAPFHSCVFVWGFERESTQP
jgi:hypothetical protein